MNFIITISAISTTSTTTVVVRAQTIHHPQLSQTCVQLSPTAAAHSEAVEQWAVAAAAAIQQLTSQTTSRVQSLTTIASLPTIISCAGSDSRLSELYFTTATAQPSATSSRTARKSAWDLCSGTLRRKLV